MREKSEGNQYTEKKSSPKIEAEERDRSKKTHSGSL